MKVCAVVSEFNPFHNGHKYLLSELRKKGFDSIICVMSGNFVQRGEYAVCDKKVRAKIAVESGADLVLSLPFPWSSASAEFFALGAVSVINSLGCVDGIGFGSECADIGLLKKCADFIYTCDKSKISDIQKNNPKLSYVQARSIFVRDSLGEEAYAILSSPNDILGLEYLKALRVLDSTIVPYPIKRISASHDGAFFSDEMCSSSKLRAHINAGEFDSISGFVPCDSHALIDSCVTVDNDLYFNFLRGSILSRSPEELCDFAENGGGFEYALYREMLLAKDIYSLYDSLSSRHLTEAKIRRALLFASLGVKKEVLKEVPLFTEVLACNEQGKEVLKVCRKSSSITILSKTANIKNAEEKARTQFKLQRTAEIAFDTLLKNISEPRDGGTEKL